MSEKTMESGQELDGAEELPTPKYQNASTDERPSSAGVDVEALVQHLIPALEDIVEKKVQSTKDRRWDKLEKQYGQLSVVQEALARVEQGQNPKEVFESLEQETLRQKVSELESIVKAQSRPSQGKSEADDAFAEAKAIISEAGLGDDSEVRELMSGTFKSPNDMLTQVNRLVLSRSLGKPKPTPAGIISSGSGTPPPPRGIEQATAEYIEKYRAALDKGDAALARKLRNEGRANGIPVDNIKWEIS